MNYLFENIEIFWIEIIGEICGVIDWLCYDVILREVYDGFGKFCIFKYVVDLGFL